MSPERAETRKPEKRVRLLFWTLGLAMASLEAWSSRNYVSADGIAYLDMSDAVFPGFGWHRLITGTWSPLYPFFLGLGRLLDPNPYHELVVGHLLNIAIFAATFLAFEVFLSQAVPDEDTSDRVPEYVPLPRWAYMVIGYALFLWASLSNITLNSLRPDMLMACFLCLAMAMLYRIKRYGFTWTNSIILGIIVGFGYLAKAPMLPAGVVIIGCSLIISKWSIYSVSHAMLSGLIMLTIGSIYFASLSQERKHFTLGESSAFNYLIYVDHATPVWYLQDMGKGSGRPVHRAARIFDDPPVYQFSLPQSVTHPLRYDPAYWTVGAEPRFSLGGQLRILAVNLRLYAGTLARTSGLAACVLLLWFLSGGGRVALAAIGRQWPMWLVGLFGLAMYATVHVEDRYVGVFFLLLWMGLLSGLRVPAWARKRVALAVTWGVAISVFLPMIPTIGSLAMNGRKQVDENAAVARELRSLGIRAGDKVARISPLVTDLVWARMARVTIRAEVDFQQANRFWLAPLDRQEAALQAMASSGARVVVAHLSGNVAPSGWHRLGRTAQWVHWLTTQDTITRAGDS